MHSCPNHFRDHPAISERTFCHQGGIWILKGPVKKNLLCTKVVPFYVGHGVVHTQVPRMKALLCITNSSHIAWY